MRKRTGSGGARFTRSRRRAATGLAGALAAAAVMMVPGTAHAGSTPINQEVQQWDEWCWAASGLTIAEHFGRTGVSQNTFCDLALGYPTSYQCPNTPGQLTWVQNAFARLGMAPGQVTGPLSFAAVGGQIDAQRPIETGIYWTAGGGHAQVIYGYDPSIGAVFYGDPWPTSPRYSEMYYSSYVSNAQFQWGQALSGMSG